MADRHIRRTGDHYALALSALLPQGLAWPRTANSVLMQVVKGLAKIWGTVDTAAADLLEIEFDPRLATSAVMLPDWERAFGLPDPCLPAPAEGDRNDLLVERIIFLGGQSRAFFRDYVATGKVGATISITEYSPYVCGIGRCGDTRNLNTDEPTRYRWELGDAGLRFHWTVHVLAGAFASGDVPGLRCLIGRYKPAFSEAVFDYAHFRWIAPSPGGIKLTTFAPQVVHAG